MNCSLKVRSKELLEPGFWGHVHKKDAPDIKKQVKTTDAEG